MKTKLLLYFAAFAVLILTACKKDEDSGLEPQPEPEPQPQFQSFEVPISMELTLPTVPDATAEAHLSFPPIAFKLDSVVKANTNNLFGEEAVGAIYMSPVEFTLLDADATNNGSNFEYAILSNVNGAQPVVVGRTDFPDTYTTKATLQLPETVNLRPNFNADSLYFRLFGKARRVTSRPLQVQLTASFRFEKGLH